MLEFEKLPSSYTVTNNYSILRSDPAESSDSLLRRLRLSRGGGFNGGGVLLLSHGRGGLVLAVLDGELVIADLV